MRSLVLLTALAAFAATNASAAAPCREKGKFVKCPAAAPAKPVKCKDAKGKFAKCSAVGAKPM